MIAIGAIEGGCSTVPIDSGCKSFKPITWSKQDTAPTQRQIVAHNKVFTTLCPAPKLAAENYP